MTQSESALLMNDQTLKGRIKVCCLKYADNILGEAPGTPAHNTRLKWAQNVYQQPDMIAGNLQPPVVMDSAVQNAGLTTTVPPTSAIDDVGLQGAVETVVNKSF